MMVGRAFRDVILVVMRIQDLVRFGHAQIWDLMKTGLAVGCVDKGGIVAPRRRVPLPALLRLATIARSSLVLPILSIALVPPIRRVSTRCRLS